MVNKILIITSISFLFSQWNQQTNGVLHQNFTGYSIDAVNENVATFSVDSDSSHLYLTYTGGSQWNLKYSIYPERIVDVSIIDSSKIWFCTGWPAAIIHSQDGGDTWTVQFSDSTITLFFNYIEMFDENNGIAMGDAVESDEGPAVILRTTNGGTNWVSVNDSAFGGYSGDLWRRIDFIDTNTGYFRESGVSPNLLFKTTDGCSTWTSLSFPQNSGHVLQFYDENIGLAVNSSTYNRTFDGGMTWHESDRPDANDPDWGMDVEFHSSDPSKVWFSGSNQVFFSNDSGLTWNVEFSYSGIRDIIFINENTGWILADNGVFYKNVMSNTDQDLILPSKFTLHPPYPNPFNPVTTIRYDLPEDALVNITIYDMMGRQIKTLVNGSQTAGYRTIQWNATNDEGKPVSAGVYLYSIEAGEFRQTKKMVLLK